MAADAVRLRWSRGDAGPYGGERRFVASLVLLAYCALLLVAELAVTYVNPVLVFPLHGGTILLAAGYLMASARSHPADGVRGVSALLLVMVVLPLIRIISLTLPLGQIEAPYRYVFAGIPMLVAGLLAAYAVGLHRDQVGLALRNVPVQVLVVAGSLALGFAEYGILRPAPLGPLPWTAEGALPALAVLISTGFPEELIFRGVIQTAARPVLGRWNWVFVSAVFAVLHVGYRSPIDLVFVFGVGCFYGWAVERTRSLVGTSIGHGLANLVLFFVAPNMALASTVPAIDPRLQDGSLAILSILAVAIALVVLTRTRVDLDVERDRAVDGALTPSGPGASRPAVGEAIPLHHALVLGAAQTSRRRVLAPTALPWSVAVVRAGASVAAPRRLLRPSAVPWPEAVVRAGAPIAVPHTFVVKAPVVTEEASSVADAARPASDSAVGRSPGRDRGHTSPENG